MFANQKLLPICSVSYLMIVCYFSLAIGNSFTPSWRATIIQHIDNQNGIRSFIFHYCHYTDNEHCCGHIGRPIFSNKGGEGTASVYFMQNRLHNPATVALFKTRKRLRRICKHCASSVELTVTLLKRKGRYDCSWLYNQKE